ncbi:ribonuclease H-like domain-containing protein [Tanacetum coccineum]
MIGLTRSRLDQVVITLASGDRGHRFDPHSLQGRRLRKRRKASGEGMFDANEDEMIFNQGKMIGEKCDDKKKISRRSVTKSMEVARKTKGTGECGKKVWIRSNNKDEHPDVVGLQETKCGMVNDLWVEDIWGRQGYGYSQFPARRNSGGIMGLNVVRSNDDRLNSQVNIKDMIEFNDFINNTRLIEILMGGRKFTRGKGGILGFGLIDGLIIGDYMIDSLGYIIWIGERRDVCEIRGRWLMICGVGNKNGDKWRWVLDEDGEFTIKEIAILVDEKALSVESGSHKKLWNKLAPKKVNIFVWRAQIGRLSVRVELDRRGIDLDSVLCHCYNNIVETCAHCLVTCDLAIRVWEKCSSIQDLHINKGNHNRVMMLEAHYPLYLGPGKVKQKAMMYSNIGRLNYNVTYTTFAIEWSENKEISAQLHTSLEVINLHPSKLNMSGPQDEIPPPPPPPPSSSQTPTQPTPHTVSTIKLPILKKGEYDIWAMKMEHYLAHTDYPIWEVIQNGNGPVSITTDTSGQIKVLPPRTAEEIVARERERKARTTLLMALPEDHLAKIWDAMKSRFGGNDESKKMQKYILKQQFEGFSLEIHGAGVSTEDANQKFLRSLLSAWSQVSLIMRTKPGVDSLSFDDLYNNLRVFESDIKGSTASL